VRQIHSAQRDKPVSPDIWIARAAARQHGVVARRQLLAIGLCADAIQRRVKAGRLYRIHTGVYVVGHPLLFPPSRSMAAVLACGGGALLSHRSAGGLWGLSHAPAGDVEVLVHRAGGRRHRGILVHSTRSLEPPEISSHENIPCTSAARTLVDLAAVLNRRQLKRALERSLELRLFDGVALDAVLDRAPGRPGVGVLRKLVAGLHGEPAPVRNELERRFLELVRAEGLPIPVVNARVCGYEVDFHWPARRLIVETDGRATHDTPHQFEEDRRRDLELTLAGWHVIRVGWRQVVYEPSRVAALLRSRLS
jgi:very-short-patch-repair endonuclease